MAPCRGCRANMWQKMLMDRDCSVQTYRGSAYKDSDPLAYYKMQKSAVYAPADKTAAGTPPDDAGRRGGVKRRSLMFAEF